MWVDPKDGWCGKEDVLAKARRAQALGMRLMIDFHYSDWWADPGKQNKPAAWKNLDLEGLKKAVADHTTDVLTALKTAGITPQWIQIGNETTGGMLWPDGQNYNDAGFANYVQLHNAGYDAAKAVFPSAQVMVHVDNGWKWETLKWFFNSFDLKGARYDLIGLSLYPEKSNWQSYNQQICNNIQTLYSQYQKETIICEVGMDWSDATTCKQFLSDLIARTKDMAASHCTGVLYWSPKATRPGAATARPLSTTPVNPLPHWMPSKNETHLHTFSSSPAAASCVWWQGRLAAAGNPADAVGIQPRQHRLGSGDRAARLGHHRSF